VHAEMKRLTVPGGAKPVRESRPLVHFQHLSAADSVTLVRRGKKEGLPISAEVTPVHLVLTDERLCRFDQNLKINPPLRSEEDRAALVAALADGAIDCVGSDHAPHAPQEKEVPIEDALFGTTGLETAFAALHTGLVLKGSLTLARLVEVMSAAPCRLLGLEAPRLAVGAPADFCVVDLKETWEVTPAALSGKSRNCAFLGETLTSRVRMTVVGGARRYVRAR
jgi:dihydroorotase